MSNEPELFFNGQKVTRDQLMAAIDESQEHMVAEEKRIAEEFGVSNETASAIHYLRFRSRWTQEKETELIERDKSGIPISLGTVLSGEF